jgi:hypothetical protein
MLRLRVSNEIKVQDAVYPISRGPLCITSLAFVLVALPPTSIRQLRWTLSDDFENNTLCRGELTMLSELLIDSKSSRNSQTRPILLRCLRPDVTFRIYGGMVIGWRCRNKISESSILPL